MAKAAATADKAKTTKTDGVGSVARAAIKEGKTNEEVLAIVKKKFPDGKTGMASINWYRNQMRQEDPKIKSARELKAAQKPAEKPKDKAKDKAKETKKVADPTA